MQAVMPLGQSTAAAIVCCAIFFVFGVLAIGNLVYSSYAWYDVVIIACFLRTCSYGIRAAYLGGTYTPAMGGVAFAFLNGGYGASVAAVCIGHAWWYKNKPYMIFSLRTENALKRCSILILVLIVAFGPITGVVAAGLIFGAYDSPALAAAGMRCRYAASYGLLMCNTLAVVLVAASTMRIFTMGTDGRMYKGGKPIKSCKNPKLVCLFLVEGLLLMIRGCSGVAALYEARTFVWRNDTYFYLLNTLPEMMALFVMVWPTLLARTACCYPKDSEPEATETSDEEAAIGG